MSDDMKHAPDDLFAGTEGDDGNRTDDDHTSDEETQDEDEGSNSLPRLEAEKQFAESWATKISSGKSSLEELEKKQPWLVPKVKEILSSKQVGAVDPNEVKRLAIEAAKELLQEERAKELAESHNKNFESLRKKLDVVATKQQKALIKERYASLLERGLSPLDALSTAAEIANVDTDDSVFNKAKFPHIKLGNSIPPANSKEVDYDTYDPNSVPLSELQKKNAAKQGLR